MEVKEVKGVVIAKPVATKPSCSSFRSFSELLAGAIDPSPSPYNECEKTTVPAIRPKTVRVSPAVNWAPVAMLSSQVSSYPLRSSVVYKPSAKVVSKATVSLLASMGSPSVTHQQALVQVKACAQHLNKDNLQLACQHISNQPPLPSSIIPDELGQKSVESLGRVVDDERKPFSSPANVDQRSYDGYNWRKYGQKQVKGSEYPRSYYKCTYPNCPVKKKVERLFDGQIAEIVYNGEHNHPKPQPPKKNLFGVSGKGLESNGAVQGQDTKNNASWSSNINDRDEGFYGHMENSGEAGFIAKLDFTSKSPSLVHVSCAIGATSVVGEATFDNSRGVSSNFEERSRVVEVDDHEDEPKSKRRRNDDENNEAGTSGERVHEHQDSVKNNMEIEIQDDGFCWRKYGQKFVKGNPFPRSYYKCTSPKCNMRKYVERTSDDPQVFITTYEGKHNHEMPSMTTSSAISQQRPKA